ncbi:hypothetical protein H257_00392 [Aphanomyces astaci]|uniref:Cysteine dioxygenase n=1 Tax=Aphanomyces astaci TaxID=112090 RepID=W4HBM3_APHAT|nr:hypothetical protein H257_00392 [Aphanomyces astaci]ETV88971.1 hypothetical protein H257_00392 [Aphanomyces astaci]|eukprot:XP_009821371.1 hypothetical protein H257_00392 [Aphanomyces astaci]
MKWLFAEEDDAAATPLSSPRKDIGVPAYILSRVSQRFGYRTAAEPVEMPLIQSIQQAVLQTVKRNGGRAFNMAEVLEIKELCDRLLPSDLGLEVPRAVAADKLPRFRPIRYIEVYEDADISMGIFVMPPGTTIPLHNHPQMTVISRVLYGSMQVNAFDLVPPDEDEAFWVRKEERIRKAEIQHNRFPKFRPRHLKVAIQRSTDVVHGPATTELLPDRCNIHEFIAVGDVGCAIFDILTPGYNPLAGRDCTYYRSLLQVEGGTEEEPWYVLEPSNLPPSSFISVDLPYRGPELMPAHVAAPDDEHSATSSE